VLVLAVAGKSPVPRLAGIGLLAGAGVCLLAGACSGFAARCKRGIRVFSQAGRKRPGSHLSLWIDAVGAAATMLAAARALGGTLSSAVWAAAGGALLPGIVASVKLERRKYRGEPRAIPPDPR
jgi:hypothetical protein